MAKSKKNKKSNKPSVKVSDMAPQKDPKGGAVNAFIKLNTPLGIKVDGQLVPAVQKNLKIKL
ncbi:MAG: hypothetical protein ACXW3E_07530 [Thermoanaerobaculia bacterium]